MTKQGKKLLQSFKKSHTFQHEQSDCGVACLLALLRFYGGDSTLEKIRAVSGTTAEGSTLLGLYQAATALGFDAEGCEADIEALIEHGEPVILHLTLENGLQHYVVATPQKAPPRSSPKGREFAPPSGVGGLLISDPAKGVYTLSAEELEKLWLSKKCLTLKPNDNFQTSKATKQYKRRWLWQLIQEDVGILAVSLVLGVLIAVLGMVMAVFSQRLIDDILPSKEADRLILGIVLVALLLFARLGLGVLRQWLLNRQSKDFNNRLMQDFFGKLLHLPKAFFDTRKIGDLTTRLHDTARIQRVISQLTNQVLIDALVIVVSLVFLFSYNTPIALLALCCLPVIFWVIYAFNRVIIDGQKAVMQSFSVVESNYIDTIQGITEIKTFDKQGYFNQKNQMIYALLQDKIFDLGKIQIRLNLFSGIASVLFLVAVLGYASYLVFHQFIALGVLMAIVSISSNILASVVNLALLIIPIQEAKVAFDRIIELAPQPPKGEKKTQITSPKEKAGANIITLSTREMVTNSPSGGWGALEVQSLAFRFAGRSQLLKNINLEVRKGELITLTGESGSGKSTLLQLIAGFYSPENGQILINEMPIQAINTQTFRKTLAYIPQNIKIFNTTLLENICLNNPQEEVEKVVHFCQKYGFDKYFQTFPQSYLTLLGENGVHLSGGQSQLVALARALYHQPQILLLDEATSAMDSKTENFVIQLLQSLQANLAIVWISHKAEIAELGKRIYQLEKGISKLTDMDKTQHTLYHL